MIVSADLFSGVGGFTLASEWAGWQTAFHCEVKPFAARILNYQFPNIKLYEDIKETDFIPWHGKIDVLSGGFPCQPFSVAGKRRGDEDDRYLWPEMCRAIREIRPRWVVGENVLGIIGWQNGVVFEEVCSDLEDQGYEVQTYVLPACGVDAPHRRYRVFFVAHYIGSRRPFCTNKTRTSKHGDDGSDSGRPGDIQGKSRIEKLQERHEIRQLVKSIAARPEMELFDPNSEGKQGEFGEFEQSQIIRTQSRKLGGSGFGIGRAHKHDRWRDFPTVSPVRIRNDGLSDWLDSISVSAWQELSIEAAANAVVPDLVLQIFETINLYEELECVK